MDKEVFAKITEMFEYRLAAKTNWGKNDVMTLYNECTNKVLLEVLEERKNKS